MRTLNKIFILLPSVFSFVLPLGFSKANEEVKNSQGIKYVIITHLKYSTQKTELYDKDKKHFCRTELMPEFTKEKSFMTEAQWQELKKTRLCRFSLKPS